MSNFVSRSLHLHLHPLPWFYLVAAAALAAPLVRAWPVEPGESSPVAANRSAPLFTPAPKSPTLRFSAPPPDAEIQSARVFEEALVPMGGAKTGPAENQALAKALVSYQQARLGAGPQTSDHVDLGGLETFLREHPKSPWSTALLTNLGIEYYRAGRFTKALNAWRDAWKTGKDETSPTGAALVDRALAELARMEARLGRMDELDALFAQSANRRLQGAASEIFLGAREGLADMHSHPEESFKCGPLALNSVLCAIDPTHSVRPEILNFPSSAKGTSLAQVDALARQLKLDDVAVRRTGAATVPTPAVVHWKLGHYGAILKEDHGRYLVEDPTFGSSQWIAQSVLDEESSGAFLLVGAAAKNLPPGWRALADDEAAAVWGKGRPTNTNRNSTGHGNPGKGGGPNKKGNSPPPKKDPCKKGMADWQVHLMLVSLNFTDTPLSYLPPIGPAVNFDLTYDLREANQPATLAFSNFGSRWNMKWISYLTFDSNNSYLHSGDGGTNQFPNFNGSIPSTADPQTHSVIALASPGAYEERNPDGSKNVYDVHDASGRYYLTQVVDPQGNGIRLAYDNQYRLMTLTDAIGQVSVFAYGLASDPLKITQITDPFGRTAQFHYNASGRLDKITDAAGLTSQFGYDGTTDAATSLTTGYGTTTFVSTDAGDGVTRSVLVTLPDGAQEKFVSLIPNTEIIPANDPASVIPKGMPTFNGYQQYRNTYYWDRKAMTEAPNDYTKAQIYHFLHNDASLAEGPLLESEKDRLENRIWYYYQNQTSPAFMNPGIMDRPTAVGRVLDDGSTQLYSYTYNALGNLTSKVDPLGRVTVYAYDPNGIDLTYVGQSTSLRGLETLAFCTYDSHHLLLSKLDAAGQTTYYTYNSVGQLLTITDPKGHVTTCAYDANRRLTSITGPKAGSTGVTSFTYDAAGRIGSVTDSLGHTVTYGYDNLDRITSFGFPDGTSETFAYTLLDVTDFKDRLNRHTTYAFNALDQLSSVTDPLNRTSQFTYCRCGAVTSLTDALGQVTKWDYDIEGRETSKTYPDGSKLLFTYENTTDRLASMLDAHGQTTFYKYNLDDSIAQVSYADAVVPTPAVTLSYDPDYRRLTGMVDGTGPTSFQYFPNGPDASLGAGRLASTSGRAGTMSYTYDELQNIVSRTVNGVTQTTDFDSLDRPTSVVNALDSFTLGYLGQSRLLSSITSSYGPRTTMSYYPASGDDLLEQITYTRADNIPISQWTYHYDASGRVTSWNEQRDAGTVRLLTPGYDAADQLTSLTETNPAHSRGYTYDVAANRTSETVDGTATAASFNDLDQIISQTPPPSTDRTYEWDTANRLTAINYTGTSNRTEISYDGLGRRSRIVEKTGQTVNSVQQFLWDGLQLVEEQDGQGNATRRFFPEGIQIVSGPSPGVYFYTADQSGSIQELLDASGAVRARYSYDPFGRRAKLNGDLDTPIGYTGHYQHVPSGLVFAPFRAYDPNTGRWISRDPAEDAELFADGPNLYAYIGNNTLNYIDLSGQKGVAGGGLLKQLLDPELSLAIILLKNKIGDIEQTRRDLNDYLRRLMEGAGKFPCPQDRKDEIARVISRLNDLKREIEFDQGEIKRFEQLQDLLSKLPL